MLQLHGDLGAVLVDPFGQPAQPRQERIAGHAHLIRLGGASREGHRTHAHDQQPGAATGTRFVIGLNAFAAMAIGFCEIGAHGRHDDAVAQRQ